MNLDNDLYMYLLNNNISNEEIENNKELIIKLINSFDPNTKTSVKYAKILTYIKIPSFRNRIASFFESSYNYISSGLNNVSEETKNSRLEICKSCEFFNPSLVQCQKCGCFLNIKTSWATEKCPLDKWGTEIDQDSPEKQPPQQVSELKDCGCSKK